MRLTYELAWSTALLYGKGLYPVKMSKSIEFNTL